MLNWCQHRETELNHDTLAQGSCSNTLPPCFWNLFHPPSPQYLCLSQSIQKSIVLWDQANFMSCSAAALLTYIIPLHRQCGWVLSVQSAAHCRPFQSSLHTLKQSLQQHRATVCVAAVEVHPDCHPRLCERQRHKTRDLSFTLWLPAWAPWVRITPMSCQRPHDSRFTLLYHLQKSSFKQTWLQYTHKMYFFFFFTWSFLHWPPYQMNIQHNQ